MERRLVVIPRTRGPALHLSVELARTEEEQHRGLSLRASIDPRGGMLFPVSEPRAITTWLMQVPLDVLFFLANWRVVSVSLDVPPGRLITPAEPHDFVLEVAGGTVRREGLDLSRPVGVYVR